MKRFLLTLALGIVCLSASSFDWKPQSNEELRNEMFAYAEGFAKQFRGTPQAREVRRFVRAQRRQAEAAPYAWVAQTADLVRRLEAQCPPVTDDGSREALMRRGILRLMDFPLHLDNYDVSAPAEQAAAFGALSASYRADARAKALEWLGRPVPEPGVLEIMKVYNQGFLLRTSARTFAVDVKWEGTAEEAAQIAAAVDAFFLSHPHKDHYSDVLMSALADAGKTVVLPSDVVPESCWDGKRVVEEVLAEPQDFCGIAAVVVRGDQGEGVPNNGYLLEFDGWRVLLPGENSHEELDEAFSSYAAPDLLLFPSWNGLDHMLEVVRAMPGYSRESVTYIPGHENELFHPVGHRESYRELFTRKDRLGDAGTEYPRVILQDIGEPVSLRSL